MKLIIVDDSHVKVEKIAVAVDAAGVPVEIVHETNAAAARKRLRVEEFDLLLIDLQLPDVAGAAPSQTGGLEFFDLLLRDTKANLPGEILFVTSEDGLVETGRKAVHARGSSLCVVSDTLGDWVGSIAGQIQLASHRASRRPPSADVAIITALGSELEAVLNLELGWTSFRLPGDPTLYYRGRLSTGQGDKVVVAASALRKGMAASAALATKLVLKFRPQMLAMTGICAGVKEKTNLGDVIVGQPTWDWGSGKHAQDGEGSAVFKLSPKQSDLDLTLATRCDEIARCSAFKRRVRSAWDGDVPPGAFSCHVGPMASGASVIANASVALEISQQNRDLIAIEMEAFAIMVAAEYSSAAPLLAIAIKSVCDYADNEKQDSWQAYAAFTSAMFALELVSRHYADS